MRRNNKRIILPVTIIICILFLTGCQVGIQNTEKPTFEIEDATGAVVSVPLNPKRVAVLFSSFADIWVTAGGSIEITVAETLERSIADETVVLVDDGAGKTINLERLIAAEPDFVICSADIQAQLDAADICRDAGIPACAFRVESFEDYLSLLTSFVHLTGQKERLKQYGTDISDTAQSRILLP